MGPFHKSGHRYIQNKDFYWKSEDAILGEIWVEGVGRGLRVMEVRVWVVEEWMGVDDVGFEIFEFLDFGNSGSLGV